MSCWDNKKAHYNKPPILKALSAGYYMHCARKHASLSIFYPAGLGRNSNLGLAPHPSSSYFESGRMDELDWVIFQEVVYTTKAYMRCVSTVNGNWLSERLPKLTSADISRLSRSAVPALEQQDNEPASDLHREPQAPTTASAALPSRVDAIEDARKRYLERKQQQQQQQQQQQARKKR